MYIDIIIRQGYCDMDAIAFGTPPDIFGVLKQIKLIRGSIYFLSQHILGGRWGYTQYDNWSKGLPAQQ